MTQNRRYQEHYAQMRERIFSEMPAAPCTLPQQAFGPDPVRWTREQPPVWAWVSWPDRPAERIAAHATGWNDRVVCVEWIGDRGTVNTMVWRSAVTRRSTPGATE